MKLKKNMRKIIFLSDHGFGSKRRTRYETAARLRQQECPLRRQSSNPLRRQLSCSDGPDGFGSWSQRAQQTQVSGPPGGTGPSDLSCGPEAQNFINEVKSFAHLNFSETGLQT